MHTRRLSYADILQQERARALREYNQCHTPGGAGGGQFCSKGGGGTHGVVNPQTGVQHGKGLSKTDAEHQAENYRRATGRPAHVTRTTPKPPTRPPSGDAGPGDMDRPETMAKQPRVRGAALKQLRRTGQTADISKPSAHPLAPGKARGASAHLNQMVNYGGVMTSRANVMRDLQKSGATPAMVDRYMQGLERGQAGPKSRDVATHVPHDPRFHRGPTTAPKAAVGPVPGSTRVKKTRKSKSRLPTSSDRKQIWWTEQD
jgi:hypothetical protein